MGRRLIANVTVRDPRTHAPRVFYTGDDVPEWAAKLITNPTVWSSEDDSEDPPEGDDETDVDAEDLGDEGESISEDDGDDEESSQDDDADAEDESEEDADGAAPVPPPASGRGSGLEAWKRYASAHGVELEDGMSRDDIIAACELAEVPIS